ncbi:cation:proton antiporter [Thermosphaera chiliense]|uniref:Cation:proton antiporter n=1 Tax=Thermosphaera chiliense TaxID=3402707 RepID=A0A7M1UQK5_9CREN|nr:proton-conducting transporter membrane subunit [Thermosphaera aggregans]QOR94356.1 cation:proton antiporter [Thermosphaera aggregans]
MELDILLTGLTPFIPVFGAFTTPLISSVFKKRTASLYYGFLISGLTLLATLRLLAQSSTYDVPLVFKAGGWPPPVGIIYILDRVNAILSFTTALVLTLIFAYSLEYIRDEGAVWYSILLLGAEAGILGIILTADFFNLFVMLEVASVSSYSLVMYYRSRAYAIISGLKYAFVGAMGTTLYFVGCALLYNAYGTLNIIDLSLKIRGQYVSLTGPPIETYLLSLGIGLVLMSWAFTIKSGVFPNHFWLPDAHPAAPTPISALLSGLVVNIGGVSLYKFMFIALGGSISPETQALKSAVSAILMFTGTCSAIVGALLMNIQKDLKRLIAYSTVMNTGFLFMAVSTGTPLGLSAFIYHTIIHSIAKSNLFLSAGIFIKATRSRSLEDISGLGFKHPVASIAFATSVLTLAGIPPLPGFLSKMLLYEALFEYNIVTAVVMILASTIGLISYMKIFYMLFFGTQGREVEKVSAKMMNAVLLALSVVLISFTLLLVAYPGFYDAVITVTVKQIGEIETYLESISLI